MIRYCVSILSLGAVLTSPLFSEDFFEEQKKEKAEIVEERVANLSEEELLHLSQNVAKKLVKRLGYVENASDWTTYQKSRGSYFYWPSKMFSFGLEAVSPVFKKLAVLSDDKKEDLINSLSERIVTSIKEEGFSQPLEFFYKGSSGEEKESFVIGEVIEEKELKERLESKRSSNKRSIYICLEKQKSMENDQVIVSIIEEIGGEVISLQEIMFNSLF